MTLPQRVFYVVRPKPICETLRHISDASDHFFLFREIALSAAEPPVEYPEFYIARAKIAFLGGYWRRLNPDQIETLFGEERDPIRMFDRAWDLCCYSLVISILNCLQAIELPFLQHVGRTDDEVIDSLLNVLKIEAELPPKTFEKLISDNDPWRPYRHREEPA